MSDDVPIIIRLRIRPHWKRALIAPRAWYADYRLFRKYCGRLDSFWTALRLTYLMVIA